MHPIITHATAAARAIWLQVRRQGLGADRWGFSTLPASCAELPEVTAYWRFR